MSTEKRKDSSKKPSDLDAFRSEVAAWLEENCPASMRVSMKSDNEICWGGKKSDATYTDDQKLWLKRMAEKGWTVPTWPKEYGGAGLSKKEERALYKEMKKLNCRGPLASIGVLLLAPALMKYGTEEQKAEHLPKIARGEIRWCQGYSEPGAGSDLASLKTSAVDPDPDNKGDHWLVNGSKIWTSYGNHADWMFCLVRTDAKASKRDGISFVMFDMETQGVSTAPIKLISGASIFCETFFEDVRVEKTTLVGELNKGWTVAKYLLQHERETIGMSSSGGGGKKKKSIDQVAKENFGVDGRKIADPAIRNQIARFQVREQGFGMTLARMGEETKSGHIGTVSSIFKYYGSELNKDRRELMLTVNGMNSLGWEGEEFNDGEIARSWLRSKANSIEGGSSEIQLNIIAKRVLNLPGVVS